MSTERLPQPRPPCRSLMGVRIVGTGSYVPDSVVTNEHLHQRLGCDSAWIVKRTGILERRHAQPHQATSDLCQEAGRRCLEQAGVHPRDVDLLILATFTADMSIPSAACLVQHGLKLNCGALEVQAACSGFMYALVTGAAYICSGASDLALVIGGDCNSRVVDPHDLKTYPLFGDGAGAVLLARGQPEQGQGNDFRTRAFPPLNCDLPSRARVHSAAQSRMPWPMPPARLLAGPARAAYRPRRQVV